MTFTGARADKPLIIGHRGACAYRPEHTLASYRLAIALGADYIEPDLVSTRDGVLVCRHENEISGTTNVGTHPEFSDRLTTKVVDGRAVMGWFSEDFTVAELKTLRARERLPALRPASSRHDGQHAVATFDEVLALVERESRRRGEVIGVYPEIKHPSYFDALGLPLQPALVADLRRHHLDRPNAEVLVQSFEPTALRELSTQTSVRLIQLIDSSGAPHDLTVAGDPRSYVDLASPSGLREISTYATGVGTHKDLVLPRSVDGFVLAPTSLVGDAHAAGLSVHVWTLRNENRFLPYDDWSGSNPDSCGDAIAEARRFFEHGVDGVFADAPETAAAARLEWLTTVEQPSIT